MKIYLRFQIESTDVLEQFLLAFIFSTFILSRGLLGYNLDLGIFFFSLSIAKYCNEWLVGPIVIVMHSQPGELLDDDLRTRHETSIVPLASCCHFLTSGALWAFCLQVLCL